MCAKTKTQISLRIRAVWLESSLAAWRNFASLTIQNEPSKDSGQTARMRTLIWLFAGRTCTKVRFLTLWLISVCNYKWAGTQHFRQDCMSAQRRLISLRIRAVWSIYAGHCLGSQSVFRRKAMTLVRLRGSAGWSESSLGAHHPYILVGNAESRLKRFP